MQIKQSVPKLMMGLMKLLIVFLFLFPLISFGQTTYIPLGSEEYILLDRMEIKMQKDSGLNFSKARPFSRKNILSAIQSAHQNSSWSKVDEYNYRRLLINNIEWITDSSSNYRSRKIHRLSTNWQRLHWAARWQPTSCTWWKPAFLKVMNSSAIDTAGWHIRGT